MQAETKTCQNCKQEFTIEPEDFAFYERIKVPPPTFCPECCLQRRLAWRNERNLYKSKSAKSGKDIISMFSSDKDYVVYDLKEWNSDDWEQTNYGKEYNFSHPFFKQLDDLLHCIPHAALINWDAVNSDYCNYTYGNKNCYLVFGGDFNEDCMYSTFNFYTKNSSDLYWVNKSELCYESVDTDVVYNVKFGRFVKSSTDCHFCYDISGCSDCFGSVSLRNKSYYFFNKKCSPEEYKKLVEKIDLGSFKTLQEVKERFRKISLQSIFRARRLINSPNSSGENIYNSKNCHKCFDIFDGAEDCRYIFLASEGVKDTQSCNHIGLHSELCYDSGSAYPSQRAYFTYISINSHDIQYSINCQNCSYVFGCVGLRNKQYCILNKQYTKEEYEDLLPKVIKQMDEVPYTDKGRKIYKYGEFFPPELSPFCYNETIAQEYFPLTKAEALEKGYRWKDPETKEYHITISSSDLPDHIKDVDDTILNEVIGCEHKGECNEQCSTAFRIIPQELEFYRKMNLPLPRLCSNCRHYQRIKQRNPMKLWHRACQCAGSASDRQPATGFQHQNTAQHFHKDNHCPNEFETSYAPDRPEIVYCEQCYQQEVV